jgi:hypothetical protein
MRSGSPHERFAVARYLGAWSVDEKRHGLLLRRLVSILGQMNVGIAGPAVGSVVELLRGLLPLEAEAEKVFEEDVLPLLCNVGLFHYQTELMEWLRRLLVKPNFAEMFVCWAALHFPMSKSGKRIVFLGLIGRAVGVAVRPPSRLAARRLGAAIADCLDGDDIDVVGAAFKLLLGGGAACLAKANDAGALRAVFTSCLHTTVETSDNERRQLSWLALNSLAAGAPRLVRAIILERETAAGRRRKGWMDVAAAAGTKIDVPAGEASDRPETVTATRRVLRAVLEYCQSAPSQA